MRRFLRSSILFGAILLAIGTTLAANSVRLDLEQAFQRMDRENLRLMIEREGINQALQVQARERARVLPSLDFRANQSRNQNANIGGIARNIPNVPRTTLTNRFSAKLVAEAPLLDPVSWANWKLAEYNRELTELNYGQVRQDLYELVATLYFLHQRNLARLRVIEANRERDQALLELARNQFDAGVATPIDVTRAEVRVATNERERLQQNTMVLQSALQLQQLLRIDMNSTLELAPFDPREIRTEPVSQVVLESVFNNNTAYVEARRTLERNQYARRAAGWERLPSLSLFGEWGYVSETIFDGRETQEWAVGISLGVPIFDGFRIRANKLQADSAVRSQEYTLRNLEEEIEADYRLSLQNVRSRHEQIAVAEQTEQLSERELELAQTRFREGVADNRDVVEAQANLAQANDGLVEAVYEYNLSRLDYARVRGNVLLLLRD